MTRETRRRVSLLASYGATAVLLWAFLRDTEWRALAAHTHSIEWMVLAAAVGVRLVSLVAASVRWQLLLAPVRRVRLGAVLLVMAIGSAVSMVAPMQAAEVVRPLLLSRRERLDFSATVATVVVEWVLDAIGVGAIVAPALLWLSVAGGTPAPGGPSSLGRALAVVTTAGIAAIGALLWIRRGLPRVGAWARRSGALASSRRARVAVQCERFAAGLRVLDRRRSVLAVGACSLLVAGLTALSAWMALLALGLPLSFVAGVVVLGLVTLGGMIPTPGAVGGFHEVCQLGLIGFFGVRRADTVLPVIALHAVLYLPAAAIGAVCLLFTRVRT